MNSTTNETDIGFMRHALGLAGLALYNTDPNPRVGCVLVRDDRLVGEGWHERAGGPHAEVHALQSAGEAARGATAYVTLEPCAGHGRTPPCTGALIGAGVARVVYAAADPNPRMVGGASVLRSAGVQVDGGLLATESRALNPGFHSRFERGRPWVRVKLGQSLDGRTALANGESRWITSPEARADVQRYRARSSVVLTGIGTVLADDPEMNVRLEGASRQPRRVLLDSQLRVPLEARMLNREGEVRVFTANDSSLARTRLEAHGVKVDTLPAAIDGGLDLDEVLRHLASLEANEVWVEAGARLAGAFLAAGLVDELVLYVAPSLLGPHALPLALLPAPASLAGRLQYEFSTVERIGPDLRVVLVPAGAPPVALPPWSVPVEGD
jgi:diaminohydroxyphosphoribosylaminopyrimidine deaminase / 5-amino-6-(5-phosphoribosylamino)uracil reductase